MLAWQSRISISFSFFGHTCGLIRESVVVAPPTLSGGTTAARWWKMHCKLCAACDLMHGGNVATDTRFVTFINTGKLPIPRTERDYGNGRLSGDGFILAWIAPPTACGVMPCSTQQSLPEVDEQLWLRWAPGWLNTLPCDQKQQQGLSSMAHSIIPIVFPHSAMENDLQFQSLDLFAVARLKLYSFIWVLEAR